MAIKKIKFSFLFFIYILILISCSENKSDKKQVNPLKYKEPLMKVNKKLVKSEEEQIDDFIQRYKWTMDKTGTGLRYMIYKNGSGKKAEQGKIVKFNYTVSLLNGDTCYSSQKEGAKIIDLGKDVTEAGLEEGILLLKTGDHAKFIIPSHLAFGLLGDRDKIPAKAALVYDIELLEVK